MIATFVFMNATPVKPQHLFTEGNKIQRFLTGELPKNAPQLSDVGGEGDVRVQDDDL